MLFCDGCSASPAFVLYFLIMANGEEDLREKNRDAPVLSQKYDDWRVLQGREDAQMLQEKSVSWKSRKDWNEKYDRDYDD